MIMIVMVTSTYVLSVVTICVSTVESERRASRMQFEGETVDLSKIVIRQVTAEWPESRPLMTDEMVTLEVTAWVKEVSHSINEKTGEFQRMHVLHVKEVDPKG